MKFRTAIDRHAPEAVLPGMFEPPPLSDGELAAIAKLVYDKSGITLHDGKRALVTARLHKRLKAVGARSFGEYLALLQRDAPGDELVAFLDAIATNHTSFFREAQHFEFLRAHVAAKWQRPGATLDVWSAACSTGEEPYTLGITLLEALPEPVRPSIRILASDLSTKALRVARDGVYELERVTDLPLPILRRYFERGHGPQEGLARVRGSVRSLVEFRQINLLEVGDVGRRFPVIFCRNVMIYFDRAVQQRVVAALEQHLAPGGHLFISHAESLNGITHGLRWVAPAVYQRRDA